MSNQSDNSNNLILDLEKGYVIINDLDLARRLRSVGAGVELKVGTKLSLPEAIYFGERGVLDIDYENIFIKFSSKNPMLPEKYAVIKYLRNRGYISRLSLDGSPYLRVHRKGFRPGEDRTHYFIHVVHSSSNLDFDYLLDELSKAGKLRKDMVIAILDDSFNPKSIFKEEFSPVFIKFGRTNFE